MNTTTASHCVALAIISLLQLHCGGTATAVDDGGGDSSSTSGSGGSGGSSGSGSGGSSASGGHADLTCDDQAACTERGSLTCPDATLLCKETRFITGGGSVPHHVDDMDAVTCILETLRDADPKKLGKVFWDLDMSGTMGQSHRGTSIYIRPDRTAYIVEGVYKAGGAPSGGGDVSHGNAYGPVALAPAADFAKCIEITTVEDRYACLTAALPNACE